MGSLSKTPNPEPFTFDLGLESDGLGVLKPMLLRASKEDQAGLEVIEEDGWFQPRWFRV